MNIDGAIQKEYKIPMTGSAVTQKLTVLKNQSKSYRFVLESKDADIIYFFSRTKAGVAKTVANDASATLDGSNKLTDGNFSISDGAIFQTEISKESDDDVYVSCIGDAGTTAIIKLIQKF